MRRLLLAVALLLVAAPGAEAKVWCSGFTPPGCEQFVAGAAQAAVDMAADGDTILLGPGNNGPIETTKVLIYAGLASGGPNASQLKGTLLKPQAMILRRGGTLRSLELEALALASNAAHALVFDPNVVGSYSLVLDDVRAFGGDLTAADTEAPGDGLFTTLSTGESATVTIRDSVFEGGDPEPGGLRHGNAGSIFGPLTATASGTRFGKPADRTGLSVGAGASMRLERVVAQGNVGAVVQAGTLDANRSVFRGLNVAFAAAGQVSPTRATARNSLLVGTGDTPSAGALAVSGTSEALVELVGSTVFVAAGESAVQARNASMGAAAPARLTLRNTIARVAAPSPNGADLLARGAIVEATGSSFSSRVEMDGGTATAPGSGTNVAGDPVLAGPAVDDFHLAPGSPLIDRADPTLLLAGELDFDGVARSLDGSADGIAAPDIGAFESPARPNLVPDLGAVSMTNRVFAPARAGAAQRRRRRTPKRGTTFRYTLSEAAAIAIVIERRAKGRRVRGRCRKPSRRNRRRPRCVRWLRAGTLRADEQAGAQETPFSGRIGRRALKPASYRARISATDIAGAVSPQTTLRFRVVKAPKPRRPRP